MLYFLKSHAFCTESYWIGQYRSSFWSSGWRLLAAYVQLTVGLPRNTPATEILRATRLLSSQTTLNRTRRRANSPTSGTVLTRYRICESRLRQVAGNVSTNKHKRSK